ncbi:hypothetical protein [Geoalkalibacter sp.]|uniref:hypothetical protein n=1 Tax=Geoalkalibacter sp. TaxID=3041440 RepID=UPI00272E421F|nr:hypothetical protein [Geoalkalibacter sp.]
MGITDKGALFYESGQQFHPFEEMTTGDKQTFEASFAPMSTRSGFEPKVRPYGLVTGGRISPTTGQNNQVDVAALTAYMAGNAGADAEGLVVVAAAGGVAVTRATVSNTHLISSITVSNAGAVTVVAGAQGTAFSEVRGAAGGPPLIPVGSIEIGQVRLAGTTAAPVTAQDIFQVPGAHQERFDYPVWSENPATGEVTFAQELPGIHTGNVTKKVYIQGYSPIFAEVVRASDFVPAEESHSTSSTAVYDGTINSVSKSLGQASFVFRGADGITDPLVKLKNEKLWFRWKQDKNRPPYSLTNGVLGLARTFPVNDHVQVACTISAEQATVDFDA